MNESPGFQANLQRGQMLRCSGRHREACQYLGEAIQADPQKAQPYLELALARSEMPGGRADSLQAVDRAIALEPQSSHFLGWKAILLAEFEMVEPAMRVAQSALELNPRNCNALLAQAHAGTRLKNWTQVERVTRQVLEIDTQNANALNLLAQALRFQDRLRESNQVVESLLAFMPNDSSGHANAGYGALKAGDHLRANRHFLEALRFDPGRDHARRGLLQSLRHRIWIYRVNLDLIEALDSSREKSQNERLAWLFAIMLSGGLVLPLVALTLPFCLILQPLSNFFLLFEPTGRRALTRKERIVGLITGFFALALFGFTVTHRLVWLAIVLGGYLGLFALGVYLPQWVDLWRARREKLQIVREKSTSTRALGEAL